METSVIMILIRDMHADDVFEVMRIERECFHEPWAEMHFYFELYTKTSYNWVLLLEDKIKAYICFWMILDEMHLNNIAVEKAFRQKGLAQKMLDKMIEFAKGNKASFITLEVNENNINAIAFYKKNGFEQVGRRLKYYQYDGADALIMTMEMGKK